MPPKLLSFDIELRRALISGVTTLANAVKVTLGPRGRNVVLEKAFGPPTITKDGVTVAREIEVGDQFANLGVMMVRQVASKTNDAAGDGTTTATVLAHSILVEGSKLVAAGHNPMDLKRGIDRAVIAVTKSLEEQTKPTKGKKEIAQVGTISANGDEEVGNIIADAMDKVGSEGVITIEEARGLTTTLTVVEGMQFDRGMLSPYFVTDPKRMVVELEEPYILLFGEKMKYMKDLLPVLEAVAREARSLLIIAENVEGEALATMVLNKVRGTLKCAAVKAPGFGQRRHETMVDIATLTGGQVISKELGVSPDAITIEFLGTCDKVIIDRDNTTIVGGAGDDDDVKERIDSIRKQIEKTDSKFDKEKFQERLAKLTGGVAVIAVGAATEPEMRERKARVEDALSATRAAVEEGVCAGGGVALLRSQPALDGLKVPDRQGAGVKIVRRAIEEPLRQIAFNAGVEPAIVANNVREHKSASYGYNAQTEKYEDLVKAGVIDPTKVVRAALQNASSVAGLLLTTDVAVVEIPQEPIKGPMGAGGGMDGMDHF